MIHAAETFSNNNEGGNPAINEGGPAWNNGRFFEDMNVDFWKVRGVAVTADGRRRLIAGCRPPCRPTS